MQTTKQRKKSTLTPKLNLDVLRPGIKTERVDCCSVCDSKSYNLYTSGVDFEFNTCANLWSFVQCNVCNHIWLNPRPSVSELPTIYPKIYNTYPYIERMNEIVTRFKLLFDWVKLFNIRKKCEKIQSYLDVGCGSGKFLKWMNQYGVSREKVYGVDIFDDELCALRERGFKVYPERIEDFTNMPNDSIDLITLFHVIEHLSDPRDVLIKLRHWLSPGGMLVIETPNVDSIDAHVFKSRYWGGYHFPRHWHLFSKDTLGLLLQKAGFEVISVQFLARPYTTLMSLYNYYKFGKKNYFLASFFDPFSIWSFPLLTMTVLFEKMISLFGGQTSTILILAKKAQS